MAEAQCPANAFTYNATLCACNPGYLLNATARTCQLFNQWGPVELDSGVDYSISFPETIFSFDSIKRFTQSQAVFLEATLLMLLSWLFFCFAVRLLVPLRRDDGRSLGFKIRWWISRLDVCFATRHWLEDQKVVKKRKTELGGTFSIASWILFIGLFAALLYQIISKRSVEVHNVRASNAPDLATFSNDLEFNITTISSMSCSHLRGLGTIVIGNLGSIEHRVAPLSTFANYSCVNTTKGPTISLRCSNCQLLRDIAYLSWHFVDLPNSPASAVGFLFNLSARHNADQKHLSFVRGTLKNGSNLDDEKPITFRGQVPNILKFNFFPRIYHNMHELKLIQPLLHEFISGSSFSEPSQLQASLQSAHDGLINTTLCVNFLTDYIVEIDSQNILGPVSFLADLGGLFCVSIAIFFYLLVQCEYRIKKLRNEDNVMRKIRSRRKAQDHWEKLRKYVMYTWGPCSLEDKYDSVTNDACFGAVTIKSFNRGGSSHKRRLKGRMDDISFSKKANSISAKKSVPQHNLEGGKLLPNEPMAVVEGRISNSQNKPVPEIVVSKEEKGDQTIGSHSDDVYQDQTLLRTNNLSLPPPPSLERRNADELTVTDLQKDLQNLYEYNVMLSEKLVATQSMLQAVMKKELPSTEGSHT